MRKHEPSAKIQYAFTLRCCHFFHSLPLIKRRELVFCLLYFEQLVKGNQIIGRRWCICLRSVLCIFTGVDELWPLPLTQHTCLEQTLQVAAAVGWLRPSGCRMFSSVQVGFAQTCVEPSGLWESCLGKLICSPLPRMQNLGQGTPSLSCLFGVLHYGKHPPGTGECSTWRSSQSSHIGNLSHFKRKKPANLKKAESAPTLPFCRSKTGNLCASASPSPPMHLPCKQQILVTPLASPSTIRFRVWGPPRLVFPQFLMICILISVLIKQKKEADFLNPPP